MNPIGRPLTAPRSASFTFGTRLQDTDTDAFTDGVPAAETVRLASIGAFPISVTNPTALIVTLAGVSVEKANKPLYASTPVGNSASEVSTVPSDRVALTISWNFDVGELEPESATVEPAAYPIMAAAENDVIVSGPVEYVSDTVLERAPSVALSELVPLVLAAMTVTMTVPLEGVNENRFVAFVSK